MATEKKQQPKTVVDTDRLWRSCAKQKTSTERAFRALAAHILDLEDRLSFLEARYGKKRKPIRTAPLRPEELKIIGYAVDGVTPVYGPKGK